VILPDLLGILYTAVQCRREVLRKANKCLYEQKCVGNNAQDRMGRFKVGDAILDLVCLDYGESSKQSCNTKVICGSVDVCACLFLLCCMRGLED
jgi:hypothetical protein